MSDPTEEISAEEQQSLQKKNIIRRNLPFFLLLFSFVPALYWWMIWSSGKLLQWWQLLKNLLPEKVYYVVEEYIALHSHNNEIPPRLGIYCIIIAASILTVLKKRRNKRELPGFFLIVLICFNILFFSHCLCVPKERSQRGRCRGEMLYFYEECRKNPQWQKRFPETLPELPHFSEKWNWHYPGAGKTVAGERFLVLEDPPGSHAGEARHRLWSDGTVEVYYPYR